MADGDITSEAEAVQLAGRIAVGDCPFDYRLARTPYLVLPKLALQSMPMEWRLRFEAMLVEMESWGIETPEYHVFRDDGDGGEFTRARVVNEATGFIRIVGGRDDPWANYRYQDIRELCPDFGPPPLCAWCGEKTDEVIILDGERLCKPCADKWVAGERPDPRDMEP